MNIKPAAAAACGVLLVSALGAQAPDVATADTWYNAVRGAGPRLDALLVENPAGVNLRDRRGGVTPLMHAAALGSIDTMRLLLDKGADVNAKSAAGATALMWAAADPAKVKLLVERGADVKAVSESGRTALLLAAMSDQSADTVAPSAGARRRREGAGSRADIDAGRGCLRQRHGDGSDSSSKLARP